MSNPFPAKVKEGFYQFQEKKNGCSYKMLRSNNFIRKGQKSSVRFFDHDLGGGEPFKFFDHDYIIFYSYHSFLPNNFPVVGHLSDAPSNIGLTAKTVIPPQKKGKKNKNKQNLQIVHIGGHLTRFLTAKIMAECQQVG